MSRDEIKVTFQPSGRGVYVLRGTVLLEAAGDAGIILRSPCGGKGTCGKCRLRIMSGEPVAAPVAGKALTQELIDKGYCLACQTAVATPMVVEVPADSTFESEQKILVSDTGVQVDFNPVVRKQSFRLPPPDSHDVRADLTRLRDAVGPVQVAPELVRALPPFLRRHAWSGTAVMHADRLVAIEAGDTTAAVFGVAVDLGTTTMVGKLFDLRDGRELALASQMNPQVVYGDDVISRITYCRENADGLATLQATVVEGLNEIIASLSRQAGVPAAAVYELTLAGNSTMQQVFCGYDTSALGEVPFVQVFADAQYLPAARLGFTLHPAAEVYVFPQIGSFVGGDTVAGMIAARLDRWDKPVLFVDIGTNGEIVLAANGRMLATSTAAGPAFEGARIRQGMRATTGAIEKVIVGEDVRLNVIGNARPSGLCGTALVDAAAGLLRAGLLEPTGRIVSAADAPADTPPALRARLVSTGAETNFMLAAGSDTASGEPIFFWQHDARELQLATGAVRAGINILLRHAGIAPDQLGAVLLAGAFGNFMRRNNARRIGLLPQVPCDRIRFIGNAASLGAKLALLSSDERDYAARLALRTEHVDLSLDPGFQMEFAEAMLFPDGDLDHCPD